MIINYKLDRFFEGRFVFKVEFKINKNNKIQKDIIYNDYIIADLINLYPKYKFIQNLNNVYSDYFYYKAIQKRNNTEKNKTINIGDIKKIKKNKFINYYVKEIHVNDILFRQPAQSDFDRYQYLLNKKNCNSRLYSYIYKNIVRYLKDLHDKKKTDSVKPHFQETMV